MVFMPFTLPFLAIGALLSIAVLLGGAAIIWEWYLGALVGTAYLIGGLVMLALSLAGRFLLLLLCGRAGADTPRAVRSGTVHRLKRPDGTELHVEQYGSPEAPALVLTHGWGMNSTEWYYIKQALSERYQVLAWDLPGLGLSSRAANNDYTTDRFAGDLQAVLELLDGRPAILAGHSIGGMTNLSFCRRFPALMGRQVVGLVLMNTTFTNPVTTTTLAPLLRVLQRPVLTPLLYLTILLSPLVWLLNGLSYLNGMLYLGTALTGFGGTQTRGQLDFAAQFTVKASPAVLARGLLGTFRYDETATLADVRIPTLIVTANKDRVTIPQASERMHAAIPGSRLISLTPAGHASLLEQHAPLVEAMDTFAQECFATANRP